MNKAFALQFMVDVARGKFSFKTKVLFCLCDFLALTPPEKRQIGRKNQNNKNKKYSRDKNFQVQNPALRVAYTPSNISTIQSVT